MSEMDEDEEADLIAEEELFGERSSQQPMQEGESAAAAEARRQDRHEAEVRHTLWGSEDGMSDNSSNAGSSRGARSRRGKKSYAAQGASEFYFAPSQAKSGARRHLDGGRSRPGSHSEMGDSEVARQHGPREEGGDGGQQYVIAPSQCHVRYMPGFNELNGLALLGHGVNMRPMIFDHAATTSTGWVRFDMAGVTNSAPARAMVFNVPAECWSTDASKFKDWQTPMHNSLRAASIAALLGLAMTPLSKGIMYVLLHQPPCYRPVLASCPDAFISPFAHSLPLSPSLSCRSGNHEEEARAAAQEGQEGEGEQRRPRDVRWYQMQSEEDHSMNIPMVVIGYEDLYNQSKDTVLAIRVWLFVFDKTHSTTDLARKLMNESAQEAAHSGAAHCQNSLRKTTAVQHAKQSRGLLGTSLATAHLELVAGMCYRHIPNVSVYKDLLSHYGGKTGDKPGKQPLDLTPDPTLPNKFPRGMLNAPMLPAEELGCTHPLALEWVFNAKRPEALCAGLVHLDGTPMDIHPDQIAVTSYFDISAPSNGDDTHVFTVPGWVGSDQGPDGKGCFYLQTDPFKLNIFDMVLPHSIAGSIKPGPELMHLFKERFAPASPLSESSPEMLNLFNNKMTGRDQWIQDQVASMTDTIVGYDTFDCTADERQGAVDAQKAAKRGIAHYGQMDGEDHVVEPRQVLKEHAFATNNVHDKLVSLWASEKRAEFASEEGRIRLEDDREHATTPISDPVFAELREEKEAFEERHQKIMKEVILLHLAKMERSFNSRMDKESIPAGYRAVWDGLQKELDSMPDRTANIAFGGMGVDKAGKCGMQLSDSDRTVFGHLQNWMGSFFEDVRCHLRSHFPALARQY